MRDLTRPEIRVRRVFKSRLPIVDSIKAVGARLGAEEEEAWRGIKAKCAAGLLTLEGIDEKGRPRTIERHWIAYTEKWGRDLPNGEHIETDMPDHEGIIAFDRRRAYRDRRSDEADGREPRSVPALRLRDVVADGEQLDELWPKAFGDLIPLNAAIERYPENRETMMRIIEAAWQTGEIALWGRRKGNAMPEPIREYRGLVIAWHAGAPKGDYYAEAHAHPAEQGAGYHRHEWEDMAILRSDLEKLYGAPETDRTFLRDNIKAALAEHRAECAPAIMPRRPSDLLAAIRSQLERGRPGKNIPWKSFCDAVRAECKVTVPTRGYGDKSIERAVREIEKDK